MLRTLQQKDIVLFGEFHNNPISHWLQLEDSPRMPEEIKPAFTPNFGAICANEIVDTKMARVVKNCFFIKKLNRIFEPFCFIRRIFF